MSVLDDLPLLASGKVREIYDLGDTLLLVASDRISTYDVVHPTPIPDKGAVLTGLSTFWFERETVRRMLDLYPDNVMFESDFPHATSLSPGPASSAKPPRQTAMDALAGLPEELCHKVLYQNAARLYGLPDPVRH